MANRSPAPLTTPRPVAARAFGKHTAIAEGAFKVAAFAAALAKKAHKTRCPRPLAGTTFRLSGSRGRAGTGVGGTRHPAATTAPAFGKHSAVTKTAFEVAVFSRPLAESTGKAPGPRPATGCTNALRLERKRGTTEHQADHPAQKDRNSKGGFHARIIQNDWRCIERFPKNAPIALAPSPPMIRSAA